MDRRLGIAFCAQLSFACKMSGSASPFDVNRRDSFVRASPTRKQSAPESVRLTAQLCGIICALIPFQTSKAKAIREWMHANVLTPDDERNRVFIYRQNNGWTNISLKSTAAAPDLTLDPVTTLKIAHAKFNECPDVSDVTIMMEGSNTPITYEQIDEIQFLPLPAPSADNGGVAGPSGTHRTDADTIIDKVDAVASNIDKVADEVKQMKAQVLFIVDTLSKTKAEAEEKDKPPAKRSR